jgi:hypothetical protein
VGGGDRSAALGTERSGESPETAAEGDREGRRFLPSMVRLVVIVKSIETNNKNLYDPETVNDHV